MLHLNVLWLLFMSTSCALEDTNTPCKKMCMDESVIEKIINVPGKIVQIQNTENKIDYLFIDIDPAFLDKQGYSTSNETTLVPCNLSEHYKNGMRVVVSGKKMSCCDLITLPMLRYSWGCKFEISSIKTFTDN